MLVTRALAKVNLTLEVLERRRDGYHEIRSVLQTVSLYDELVLRPAAELRLQCNRPDLETENNLVMRAARLLRLRSGVRSGAEMLLRKAIPTAAGLGGGSSDAAAALRGLTRLWEVGLSTEALGELAAELGSDVPFFLVGGTALALGRGEIVRPLPDAPTRWLVLLGPPIAVSTADVYDAVTPADYTGGERTLALATALAARRFPPRGLFNGLEAVAVRLFPEIAEARQRLADAGAEPVLMSGSGSTVFGFFSGEEAARAAELVLRSEDRAAWAVRTVGRAEATS